MAVAAPDPWIVAAAVLVALLFVVVAWLLRRFHESGFTVVEAVLILLVAALVQNVDLPLFPVGGIVVGVNLAGAVIPLFVATRMVLDRRARPWRVLVVALVVGLSAWWLGDVVPGRGIVLRNILVPAALALLAGWAITAGRRREMVPTAYAGGTVGVLVGLDVLLLPELLRATEDGVFLSVGGAGVGDAVFLVGVGAVLLDVLRAGLTKPR